MTELTALLMCSWRKWAAGGESRRQTKGGRVSLDIYTSLTLPVSGCSHSCCLPEKCHSEECFFFFLPPPTTTTQLPCPPPLHGRRWPELTKARVLKKNKQTGEHWRQRQSLLAAETRTEWLGRIFYITGCKCFICIYEFIVLLTNESNKTGNKSICLQENHTTAPGCVRSGRWLAGSTEQEKKKRNQNSASLV